MRHIIITLIFLFSLSNATTALANWAMVYGTENDQEFGWNFFWLAGDRAHDVIETADGDFIFTGQITLARDDDNRRGFWVCKTDRHGEVVWQKNLGFGVGFSIAASGDGNFTLVGTRISSNMTGPWTGKLRIVKINPQGNVLWDKVYGRAMMPFGCMNPLILPWPAKIIPTNDGGYFVAGSASIYDVYNVIEADHLWLIKVDDEGNLEWENAYDDPGYSFFDCRQTYDGSYIVTGMGTSLTSGLVLKLDPEGAIEWGKVLSNVRGQAVEAALDEQGNPDGYVMAAVDGPGNWILARLSAESGEIIWQKTYDFLGQPMSITQTSDRNFIVSGLTNQYGSGNSDGVVMKIDPQGNPLWAKTYGGPDTAPSIQYEYLHSVRGTSDGGLVAAGFTRSLGFGDGNSNTDALILKINTEGELNNCTIDATSQVVVGDASIIAEEYTGTPYSYNPQIYQTADPDYIEGDAATMVVCREEANLRFHQQADTPDPIGIGDTVTYTIVLENMGSQDATGVVVTGSVSSGENMVVGWSGDMTVDGLSYTCNVGDLAVGETETFSIVVQTTEAGVMESRATAVADQHDPWPDNNETFEETSVEHPGLSVRIQDNPDPTCLGCGLSYTVRASNFSTIDATGVVLTDTLPSGFDPSIYVCSLGAAPTLSEGVVTCNIGNLPAGQSAVLTLGGTVNAAGAGVLTNTAELTANGVDPLPQHSAVEETAVQYPDLAVEISDWSDPVQVGYYLIYTVTVSNLSAFPAQDVLVTDTLPPDTELVSCVVSQGTCTPGTGLVTAGFGSLNGESSAQMTLVVKVLSEGSIVNTAEVSNALGQDHDPANNIDTETTEITTWFKQDLGRFGGEERRPVSLDTDPSGNIWMAFIYGDGHLKVSDNSSGSWQITTFPGFVWDAALTVDDDGIVHMVYSEDTVTQYNDHNHYLKYISNKGGMWSEPQLVLNYKRYYPFKNLNIIVDALGTIHVACIGHVYNTSDTHLWYFKSFIDNNELKFTEQWQPGIWSVSLAVEECAGAAGCGHFSYFSEDVLNDGSNHFGIGYHTNRDSNGSEIVYPDWGCAQCDGGYVTDIALDSQNNPHIVYAGQENNTGWEHYWHAAKNGDTWEHTRLADGYIYSCGCAVDLDANDGVHTVVYDVSESDGKIAYVVKQGDAWETTTIYARDNGRIPLLNPNIVVDAGQTVHIAFLDDNSHLQIHSNRLSADADLDAVSDTEEMGPEGTDPTWDGNADGTPDFQQAHVTSLKAWNDSGYVTLAVPEGRILTDVRAIANPSPLDTPVDYDFPFGWFSFKIIGLNPGDAVPVEIFLPEGSAPAAYFKYGPTFDNPNDHWYRFDYDNVTETGAQITNDVITLNLIDGKRGDSTLNADGIIFEPGAPAIKRSIDDDTDHDGVPDNQDNCPSTANADQADSDEDGAGDACDDCQNDPDKTEPGKCGCGVPDIDTDADGEADCMDEDDDNDGMPDVWEEQYPDDLDPLVDDAADDSDGDGWNNLQEYQKQTEPDDPNSHPTAGMPWLMLLLDD